MSGTQHDAQGVCASTDENRCDVRAVAGMRATSVSDANQRNTVQDEIDLRVAQLKKELANTDSVYDTEKLSERIAKLAGGVAVIKVGAASETELEDKKLRIEDAKNATFAAVEEGIVPGGGAALLHLSELVPAFKMTLPEGEERVGADIVQKSLSAPIRLIASNAGFDGEVRPSLCVTLLTFCDSAIVARVGGRCIGCWTTFHPGVQT